MDNQQDQLGAPTPSNANRASQTPDAASNARKTSTAPMAQSTVSNAMTPGATPQTTATAGTDRQGEGQQTNAPEGTLLDTALQSGKKWIEDSGVLNRVNDLPHNVKEWGNRAVSRVGDLSTTQKIVGGALLAVGIGYLATRKKWSDSPSPSNAGRQDSGSYGRRTAVYQAPDASASRRPVAGSGRYGGSGSGYSSNPSKGSINTSGDGPLQSSSHSGSGFSTSASASGSDYGARTSESSYRKNDDFRSIE